MHRITRQRLLSLAIPLSLAAAPAAAQTVEDHQAWLNLTVQGPVSGKLVYFAEVQPRIANDVSRLDQLILRPAIGWRLGDHVTVYQGYAHVVLPVEGGDDRNEERLFQQLSWTLPQGPRAELQSRTRLEQRWRSDGNRMGLRLREMIRGEIAFDPSGRGIRALGSIEAFVALRDTDWGNRAGFDQLRTFAGVEVPVGGKSTIEAGYLNQIVDGIGVTRVNHVASVALFIRR